MACHQKAKFCGGQNSAYQQCQCFLEDLTHRYSVKNEAAQNIRLSSKFVSLGTLCSTVFSLDSNQINLVCTKLFWILKDRVLKRSEQVNRKHTCLFFQAMSSENNDGTFSNNNSYYFLTLWQVLHSL